MVCSSTAVNPRFTFLRLPVQLRDKLFPEPQVDAEKQNRSVHLCSRQTITLSLRPYGKNIALCLFIFPLWSHRAERGKGVLFMVGVTLRKY